MLKILLDKTLNSIFNEKIINNEIKIDFHYINPSKIFIPPYKYIFNIKPNILFINCFNLNDLNINENNILKYLNIKYNIITKYVKYILKTNIIKIIIVINKNCYLWNYIDNINFKLNYKDLINHKFRSILFQSYLYKCLMKKINFIPLGLNCFPAGFLKYLQLKFTSYPFDWLQLFNFNNIVDIINNNYQKLFNLENLILNYNCNENKELCIHKKYGKIFVHHCPQKNINYFKRCLYRFKDILLKKNNIFIIRIDIDKNYELLYNTIKKINKNDFTLIIFKIISTLKQNIPSNDVNIDTYKDNCNIKIFSIHLKTSNIVGSLIQDNKSLYNLSLKFLFFLHSIL